MVKLYLFWVLGHFNILEKLGADLERVFSAICGELLSWLRHCDQIGKFLTQTSMGIQLGLETQTYCRVPSHLRVEN